MLAAHRIMFFESSLLTAFVVLCALLLGLVAGSICHKVVWRITHGQAAYDFGSVCPSCGYPFSLRESLPLFGWISRGGACPACGEVQGIDEPACELLCSLIFGSVVLRHGVGLQTLELLALVCMLMVAAFASLQSYQIPNGCILGAVAIRVGYLAALAVSGEPVADLAIASVVGACALGIPLAVAVFLSNAMLARDVTGMGTVKLVAVVGLYLGWQQGLLALAVAALTIVLVWVLSPTKLLNVEVEGGVHRKTPEEVAAIAALAREARPTREEDIAEPMRLIPFAPSIALALWVMLLIGVSPAVWSSPLF